MTVERVYFHDLQAKQDNIGYTNSAEYVSIVQLNPWYTYSEIQQYSGRLWPGFIIQGKDSRRSLEFGN